MLLEDDKSLSPDKYLLDIGMRVNMFGMSLLIFCSNIDPAKQMRPLRTLAVGQHVEPMFCLPFLEFIACNYVKNILFINKTFNVHYVEGASL